MSDGDKISINESRQGRALSFRPQLIHEGTDGKICCLETNFRMGTSKGFAANNAC